MQTSWRATGRTITNVTGARLRIAHLYADEMNIYGDRGNILALSKRAEWRGIPVEVRTIDRGPAPDLSEIDLIFWGGGQDRDQELVFKDAAAHKVRRSATRSRRARSFWRCAAVTSSSVSTTSPRTARSFPGLGWSTCIR